MENHTNKEKKINRDLNKLEKKIQRLILIQGENNVKIFMF